MSIIPVTSLDQLDSCEMQWLSPLHIHAAKLEEDLQGCWAMQLGATRTAKYVAAKAGFPTMTLAGLIQLAQALGCKLPAAADMFDVLQCLIKLCCPGISDSEVHAILARRSLEERKHEPTAEIMNVVADIFGKDSEDVEKWAEKNSSKKDESFHAKLTDLYEKVQTAAAPPAPPSCREGSGRLGCSPPSQGRYPRDG